MSYIIILVHLFCVLASWAHIGIGLAQIDSQQQETTVTLDYETQDHHYESGIGLSFNTEKAKNGEIDFTHDSTITSYLGILNPFLRGFDTSLGTRISIHLTDDNEKTYPQPPIDAGIYTGIKYQFAPHILFYSRVEALSYHAEDTRNPKNSQPDLTFFKDAMTGLTLLW